MREFSKIYSQLNKYQKEAVDTTEGPLLIIAGPGTGKTQLLSARVAQILKTTDTLPQNILCLTFTENGAQNMRERLTRFIGRDAHSVTISTYHAFGGDLIKRFPEYFAETRLQDPVDELGRHQFLLNIVDKMSYSNPLKQTRHHMGDLISTVSDIKRAMLSSDNIRDIAKENFEFINSLNARISEIFKDLKRMPSKLEQSLPYFNQLLTHIDELAPKEWTSKFPPLSVVSKNSLISSIKDAMSIDKSTPLTAWKNKWLVKDSDNNFVLAGSLENKRLHALANVLDEYQAALENSGLYDFDDMIIRAVESLERNDDLRYTLHEQYLYLMLDEFQDTNAAQLKLIEMLSNNPTSEGRPNIMAVGDDDQAIYAFQGAQYSNMLDFYNMFIDVKVINLRHNYRSHTDVLSSARMIAEQIEERLHNQFDGMTKTLIAANNRLPSDAVIIRSEFKSDLAEYNWVANKINSLIANGTEPKEIAVLAPKHRYLEPLVPFLNELNIPVRYEKRENILQTPVIKQLLSMSRLVVALSDNNHNLSNALWLEILSYDFWQLPIDKIWQISWKVNDDKDKHFNWTKALLENTDTKKIALLFLSIAAKVNQESLETILDYLTGTETVNTNNSDIPQVNSPLKQYYLASSKAKDNPVSFYEILTHLKVLREKLREHQRAADHILMIIDLLKFVDMYDAANQQMINTSPYNQDINAVQIMTVYKAKGLEYEHVFLPCCSDEVWGSSSRGNSNKLTLPINLSPIRHAGANDDERLRIFFVALTRAKFGLYISSYLQNYSGKLTKRLKYLDEQEQTDGTFKSMVLPVSNQSYIEEVENNPALKTLEINWQTKHRDGLTVSNIRGLLEKRLTHYRLSPTHLNTFVDVEYGGPEAFFYNSILRFPQAPSEASQFGNAAHEVMEWVQNYVNKYKSLPSDKNVIKEISRIFSAQKLTPHHEKLEIERGTSAIIEYLKQRGHTFRPSDKAEHNFWNESVAIGDVLMTGKIDKIEIDENKKIITVVDYKTGKSYDRWKNDMKLYKYKQQLYCYKLLIENSNAFAGYKVEQSRLEFIEPDENNKINFLVLDFDDTETQKIKKLLQSVWKHIMRLEFPDIGNYSHNLKGALEFEKYLLDM